MEKTPMGTRHVVLVLAMLVNLVSYVMRHQINLTIIEMVAPLNNDDNSTSNTARQLFSANTTHSTGIGDEVSIDDENIVDPSYFDWSESMQGHILGAFFYGYTVTNVFGGQLADVIGTKLLLSITIIVSTATCLLTPMAAYAHVNWLIATRVIMGFVQGVVTSALYTLIGYWFPKDQQGFALSLIQAAGQFGIVLSLPVAASLIQLYGWESVFYACGIFGLLLLPFWLWFVHNKPDQHPRIGAVERAYIIANVDTDKGKKPAVPWIAILSSRKMWIIGITRFCSSWGQLFLRSRLPGYLHSVVNMPLKFNSNVNTSIGISFGLALFLWGWASDWNEKRGFIRREWSRKIFQSIGMFTSALCLAAVPLFGNDIWPPIIMLNLAMIMIGATSGGEALIVVDIAPDFAGSTYGFTNAFASMPGIFAPLIVGITLDNASGESVQRGWFIQFFLSSAITVFGALLFLVGVDTKPEPWGVASNFLTQKSGY